MNQIRLFPLNSSPLKAVYTMCEMCTQMLANNYIIAPSRISVKHYCGIMAL